MTTSKRELAAATKLDGADRYRQFVKLAAHRKQVWGLWHDGWALSRDAAGKSVFPLWAAREHAELCATGPWQGYEAEQIPLEDLLDQLLPQLARDEVNAGVFPLPEQPGSTPPIAQLIRDLEHELDPAAADDETF